MMELALEWVPAEEVTEADLRWLERADDAGGEFHKIPWLQIEHALKQGKMHLFRYRPGPGVVLTETLVGATGIKRLNIIRTAGENVALSFGRVAELLSYTAAEWGCEAIETMVYSPKLAKAMQRVGAKAEAVNMVLEVRHGH